MITQSRYNSYLYYNTRSNVLLKHFGQSDLHAISYSVPDVVITLHEHNFGQKPCTTQRTVQKLMNE